MGPIFFILIVLVLSCRTSSGHELDWNGDEVVWVHNGEIKTNLIDLNDDVLYLILNPLELKILLNIVQVNSRFSNIVKEVIRRRYRNHILCLSYHWNPDISVYKTNENLIIYDIPITLNLLKYFGHNFQSIKMKDSYAKLDDLINICQSIEKYCSKSLKKLYLEPTKYEILNKFTGSFETLEELNINYGFSMENTKVNVAKPLGELFPNLRRLMLHSYCSLNYSFINTILPKIEHVHISSELMISDRNSENVKGFLQKNPTIRSLEVSFYGPFVMTSIREYLPQLENLTLHGLTIGNDTVQLKNVKNFVLTDNNFPLSGIDKLYMPRLESLNTEYHPDNSSQWMTFFNNHTQLRHLQLRERSFSFDNIPPQINVLTENLLNLTNVTIKVYDYLGIDPIIQFIETHRKLNKFQFAIRNFSTDQERKLRERYESEWNISSFELNFNGLSFERKQPIED